MAYGYQLLCIIWRWNTTSIVSYNIFICYTNHFECNRLSMTELNNLAISDETSLSSYTLLFADMHKGKIVTIDYISVDQFHYSDCMHG